MLGNIILQGSKEEWIVKQIARNRLLLSPNLYMDVLSCSLEELINKEHHSLYILYIVASVIWRLFGATGFQRLIFWVIFLQYPWYLSSFHQHAENFPKIISIFLCSFVNCTSWWIFLFVKNAFFGWIGQNETSPYNLFVFFNSLINKSSQNLNDSSTHFLPITISSGMVSFA